MLGAFRTLRQSLVHSGLVFFGNLTLVRPVKKAIQKTKRQANDS